jgi:hypothetical protein
MSDLTITVNLDNDSFNGNDIIFEVETLLRRLADKVEELSREDLKYFTIKDSYGNTVGGALFDLDENAQEEPTDVDENRAYVKTLSRDDVVTALRELCGIQSFDEENTATLRECLVFSILDGATDIAELREALDPRHARQAQ